MAKELEIRKCVLTGASMPKEELLRFVLLQDGTVVPDFNKKLDGHGFYISDSKALLEGLVSRNPLNKILHTKTVITADLPQIVEQILCKKGLDAINLARKSGNLVLGFEKVKDIAAKGKIAFIIEALDAGHDSKQKMMSQTPNIEKLVIYDVATLSKALNRENTVYAALLKGPVSQMVHTALIRYQTFLQK